MDSLLCFVKLFLRACAAAAAPAQRGAGVRIIFCAHACLRRRGMGPMALAGAYLPLLRTRLPYGQAVDLAEIPVKLPGSRFLPGTGKQPRHVKQHLLHDAV